MPALTDNEARALAYFAIGVTSEGTDRSYRLSFAGNIVPDAHGVPRMYPKGNSGYSIGTLQTDLGQHNEAATALVDAYQRWAGTAHPDWALDSAQRAQTVADLGRDGDTIRAQNRRALDPTVKSHLDQFLASDAGKTFVHQHDVAQVDKLMTDVVTPLRGTALYQHASAEDQARLLAITAKAYNQSEVYGRRVLGHIQDGSYRSVGDVGAAIDRLPEYMQSGRDNALRGAELFNDLQRTAPGNAMHAPWQSVLADPMVNPTRLGADPARPNLPHEYAVIKDAYVDPSHSRPMIQALEHEGSYAKTANGRGFYAEGRDMVVWDRFGDGHALVGGSWRGVNGHEIATTANRDHTLDVNLKHNGTEERLLHVTHPGAAHSQPARGAPAPGQASGEHIQHPGSLREHDHGAPVQELQARLAALGYTDAHDRKLIPDGDFGAGTKAAVEAFQRSHHLEPDGIAGAKTLDALRQAEHPRPAPAANLADAAHPGHAMYQQALRGVHGIDAGHGRTPDRLSDNLAAALAVEAHKHGLNHIDHVVLSDDGKRAYAVQGELNSPFKRIADVDVGQSVAKPAAQSGAEWNAPQPGHAAPSHAPQPVPPPQPQPAEPPPMHR